MPAMSSAMANECTIHQESRPMKSSHLALLPATAMLLWIAAGVADPLPILHDGEAPQVGHERIYRQSGIPVYRFAIQQTYSHDTADYTEALFMHDGFLYEGTGKYGRSRLKKWNLATGEVKSVRELEARYFGEGAVALKDRLYQLTYISNTGFIYRPHDLSPIERFHYPRQGWGMTTDGEHLIVSDGSAAVAFLDPETFETERDIVVRDGYGEVGFLNELEYVDGDIFANVWQTDYLVRFSAETGAVNGWVDLSGLNPNPTRLVYPHVLNGVAYNGEPGTLLVTGKNWPNLWHIKLVETSRAPD
jgi:glutamine cyclotransferase